MLNVYEQIDRNKRRSTLIIGLFVVFIGLIGWFFAEMLGYGLTGLAIALVVAGLMSFFSYFWSDKIILTLSGARPASRQQDSLFYSVVENLTMAAQLPRPELYVIEDSALNAFATGRDPEHAVVCVTSGLLKRLNRTELEGVIGHELSHVKNYDIRLMSLVTVLVGMITLLVDWFLRGWRFSSRRKKKSNQLGAAVLVIGLLAALLSPLIAQLIRLAISRRREFMADAGSVKLTRQPSGLISALAKLAEDKEPLEAANKATAHLYITNPLKNLHQGVGWLAGLFNTHPPIEARIKALEQMV